MAGSTLKEGTGLLDGWLHIEGRDIFIELPTWIGLLDDWLHVEGRGLFTEWLAPR